MDTNTNTVESSADLHARARDLQAEAFAVRNRAWDLEQQERAAARGNVTGDVAAFLGCESDKLSQLLPAVADAAHVTADALADILVTALSKVTNGE